MSDRTARKRLYLKFAANTDSKASFYEHAAESDIDSREYLAGHIRKSIENGQNEAVLIQSEIMANLRLREQLNARIQVLYEELGAAWEDEAERAAV